MFQQDLGVTIIVFLVGLVFGIILTLLINKVRSGSASPVKVKREMDEYQDKVEAHFEETSEKFKQMATQYQDLYQHLSVGATTLCRPENIAPGLIADKDPLKGDSVKSNVAIEKQQTPATDESTDKTTDSKDAQKKAETDSKIKADLEKLKADQAKAKQPANNDSKPAKQKESTEPKK